MLICSLLVFLIILPVKRCDAREGRDERNDEMMMIPVSLLMKYLVLSFLLRPSRLVSIHFISEMKYEGILYHPSIDSMGVINNRRLTFPPTERREGKLKEEIDRSGRRCLSRIDFLSKIRVSSTPLDLFVCLSIFPFWMLLLLLSFSLSSLFTHVSFFLFSSFSS